MNTEQVGYFIKRNMPTILSIGAAIGVVVSNVLTNKASIKATLKIDEVEKKKHRELTFIEEVNASEKGNTDYLNSIKTYYTSKLQKDLAPGESNEVTLKASKLLTSSEDNTFDNKTEIVDVTRKDGDITGTPVKVTWNNGKFFFDTDNAEKTVIIPSTGENRNYVLPTVIGIIAVAIVGVGVFFIKKYVVDRNK